MIVPFAPGGPTDVIARVVAQKLSEAWRHQVVVDNRAGAGGNIGMGLAANATADGYTIAVVSSSLRRQSVALREDSVRPVQELRAGHQYRGLAQRVRRAPVGAGENACRTWSR